MQWRSGAPGSSVTLSAANIPDDPRSLGSVTQPRLKAFVNREPYIIGSLSIHGPPLL
jgi:hypothetical protein